MTTPKTRRTTAPAGDTGWIGRVASGFGIAIVIAAGTVLSPGGTSAGHDWTSILTAPVDIETSTHLDGERPLTGPRGGMIRIDRADLAPQRAPHGLETTVPDAGIADSRPHRDRAASRARVVAQLLERVRSGLERWSGVAVTSAAR